MHESTRRLLDACDATENMCPVKTGAAYSALMRLVRGAAREVGELRTEYAIAVGDEDDQAVRARLAELDQKLGGYEREVRKLADQAARVQEILRELRDFKPRFRADVERIAATSEQVGAEE